MEKKILVLSLDGGGSRASIMARALGAIYDPDMPGREIIRKFDYAAGNSGGSIVMTALCCDYTPNEIAACYEDAATLKKLFSPKWYASIPGVRNVGLRLIPLYSSTGKHEALRRIFDRKHPGASHIHMRDWPSIIDGNTDLIVSAFDYDQQRATFFRSNAASLAASSSPAMDVTLVDAVHASTSAPIAFYDKPGLVGGRRYWDGGLGGYDNPVLAAVVEALANHPGAAERIRVLSIGNHGQALPPSTEPGGAPPWGEPHASTCLKEAIGRAAEVIFGEPPDAASYHAHIALGQRVPARGETVSDGHVVRVCPLLRPQWDAKESKWAPLHGISAEEFEAMKQLQIDSIDAKGVATIRMIADRWIGGEIPNQPIRRGERFHCDIGHDTFGQAAAHWKRIS